MESIGHTAARLLGPLLAGQPTTEAKVAFAWQIAAGPALSRAVTLSWSEDGTLRVRPASRAWRAEIRRARPMITERLAHLLGADVVKKLVIEDTNE
jgi:hypothetical protein